MKALLAVSLLACSCTTISLARMDRCTVRTTNTFLSSREEVLFCDEDPPTWSNDRAVRLTQECLYQHRQMHRDALLTAQRADVAIPDFDEDTAMKECLPASIRTMQSENEALKDRVARQDSAQARMEERHTQLENGLTKALDRPINAVADARSNSDSGSDAIHSPEVAHYNSDYTVPREPIHHVVMIAPKAPATQGMKARKSSAVADAKRPTCPICPTPGSPETPAEK